jgi:hypothetical protein
VSRRDDECIVGILDAASGIAGIIEPGRDAWAALDHVANPAYRLAQSSWEGEQGHSFCSV